MVSSEDIITNFRLLDEATLAARQAAYENLGGQAPVEKLIRLGASDYATWDRLPLSVQ